MGRHLVLVLGMPAAFLVACQATQAAAVENRKTLRTHADKAREEWWPFSPAATPTPPPARRASTPRVARIEDVKDEVMMSSAFGHKTLNLCREAPKDELSRCRQIAGERIWCALLRRHAERYESMEGAGRAKETCGSIDIMENSVEAAKDEQLEEDSQAA